MGGGRTQTKFMLNSTQVEVEVEVGVEIDVKVGIQLLARRVGGWD